MICINGVPVIGPACALSNGVFPAPPVVTPPPGGSTPEVGNSDVFIWCVAWRTNSVRVQWFFDGEADEYRVYKNTVLLETTTESFIIDPAEGLETDLYVVEAWRDGEIIDDIGPVSIDPLMNDCNMLLIGTIVDLACNALEGIEVYIYDQSKTAIFANRSLLSKIKLLTKTSADGTYAIYVKRGLRTTIHIPSADFEKTLTLPCDTPVMVVQNTG